MPDLDYLLYTRQDAGRELPGSGLVLTPGTPMPLFGKGAVDGELAMILVKRGDCIYCDEHGNVPSPDHQPQPQPEPEPEPQHQPEPEPEPQPEPQSEPVPVSDHE